MAKNRTKSLNDIENQGNRLRDELKKQIREAGLAGDDERVGQLRDRLRTVLNAASRYTRNITKQKADINAVRKADDLQRKGEYVESMKVAGKADSRQWSQATYMGNNKG